MTTQIVRTHQTNPSSNSEVTPTASDSLTLWLQADVALSDAHGLPVTAHTLLPALVDALSLPESILDWSKSDLRFRRYSAYNAHRHAYDMERQVIEKGSILHLHLTKTVNVTELATTIGLYQAQGLGEIVINHPLLNSRQPVDDLPARFIDAEHTLSNEKILTKCPDHPLLKWLNSQQDSDQTDRADRRYADALGKQLKVLYHSARLYAGAAEDVLVGPSATQWGLIAEKGKQYQHSNKNESLFNVLFDVICSKDDEGWGASFEQNNETCFATWLETALKQEDVTHAGHTAALLARIAQDYIKQHKRGE